MALLAQLHSEPAPAVGRMAPKLVVRGSVGHPAPIMSEQSTADIAAILRARSAQALKPIEFDVNADEAAGEIQLVTDAWTLALENLPAEPSGWVAIDAEPEHVNEYDHAIRDSFARTSSPPSAAPMNP